MKNILILWLVLSCLIIYAYVALEIVDLFTGRLA